MQRGPEIEIFYRLPAPPTRLDLTQEVLRTTGRAPDPSGDAGDGQDRVLKFAWPARGIPRSARGRARPREVATPRGCAPRRPTGEKYIQDPYQNFKNRALENPKNTFG